MYSKVGITIMHLSNILKHHHKIKYLKKTCENCLHFMPSYKNPKCAKFINPYTNTYEPVNTCRSNQSLCGMNATHFTSKN